MTVDSRQATVLVVEDQDSVRALVRRVLERGDHRVVEAGDGRQGLAEFERVGGIDLLVTDVVMPHLGGPELAAAARARQPDLCVLFISGYTTRSPLPGEDDARSDFLAKPFSLNELRSRVDRLLQVAGEGG